VTNFGGTLYECCAIGSHSSAVQANFSPGCDTGATYVDEVLWEVKVFLECKVTWRLHN